MMLTWKVFVIIMSVVTLTPVNVKSSSKPSSSGASSRPPREKKSSHPRNPLIKYKEIFRIYDRESDLCFELKYNTSNPFEPHEILGYQCYKQLRMICDIEAFEISSGKCAHNAILMYKKSLMDYNDGENYIILLDEVHSFFWNFPLKIKAVRLPEEFCEEEANIFMEQLKNYEVYFAQFQESIEGLIVMRAERVKSCMEELKNYQALVVYIPNPYNERQIKNAAFKLSRERIVEYAIINISKIGLVPNSIEAKYLENISSYISTSNSEHNPHTYCRNLQNKHNAMLLQELSQHELNSQNQYNAMLLQDKDQQAFYLQKQYITMLLQTQKPYNPTNLQNQCVMLPTTQPYIP